MKQRDSNKQIFLIVTGFSCNNNCVICSVRPKGKDFSDRTTDEIIKDLIGGREKNYERVEFTGGEPSIRKDILYLIKQARGLGYKEIGLSTNGRLLSYKSFCEDLVKEGINRITFTLHAHEKKLHEIISCAPNSFEQTLAGIKNALSYKNVSVSVNTVIFKLNYQHIFQIGKFIYSLGVPQWNILDLIPDGYAKERYKALCIKMAELSDALSSLKPLLNDFQNIIFFDFSLCLFPPDMLNHPRVNFITAQGRLEITKQIGYDPKRFSKDSLGGAPTDVHKERIAICENCIFSKECAGIWTDYLNLFGDDEIKKLTAKHSCLKEKLNLTIKESPILPVDNTATPKEIHTYIQINSVCNQKCVFCNRPPEGDKKIVVKLEEIKKRIKEASINPGAKRIIFTGGEPLLYPNLSEAVHWAKKYGFTTEIQTNGTFLNIKKLSELKKTGLDIINFALHSHKKNISNKLRGVNFGFEEIVNNLRLADKMGFKIHIIHVINSINYKDLPKFIDYVNNLNLHTLWLNLSIVVPEGWAWDNKWIIPRMRDIKPYLIEAMKRCKKYKIKFNVSEIVPLCIVNGFEEHAISTLFKISNLEIVDDYLTGKRSLDFVNLASDYAAKAPQCQECTFNNICAGFYPRLKELYGVNDFIPRKDNSLAVLKKINLNKEITNIFENKEIETFSHENGREPKTLYINIDERCNQDCVFCVVKGKNKGKFGSMSKCEVEETIKKFTDFGGKEIIFTGGEPTLRDDLPGIIEYAEQFNNLRSISIITNGVRLSDRKYLKNLIGADKKNKMSFCISLHSHKEKVSELLTGTKGVFKKTISGIKNIIKMGRRVSIYQVITSKNYKDLLTFSKFLNKNYPKIKDITFAYPFPQGNALLNDWIYVKFSFLRPYLLRTLKFLEKRNYTVNIAACGQFPLCVISGFEEKVLGPLYHSEEEISGVIGEKSFHEFEMASKEWVNQYKNKSKQCEGCILNRYCQGFWKKYTDLFGFDGVQRISKDNFKGNKIKSSLRSGEQIREIINKIKKDKVNLIMLIDPVEEYCNKLIDFLKSNRIFAIVIHKNNILYPK